jgi:lipoprotein-anchoring transpeptidase ErfK/SrfK
MAKYRYRPYRSHRNKIKRRNAVYFLLALVVIIAGITFLGKLRNKEKAATGPPEKDVALPGVEPTEPDTAPQRLPQPEPEPEAEPAKTIIEPADVGGEAAKLIAEAQRDINAGRTIAARDKLNLMLEKPLGFEEQAAVKATLAELSNKWLFSRDPYAGDTLTGTYKVQPGDLLEKIAKNHKVPYEILMTINNIKRPQQLRAGETIKIINGPFHAIIYRSTFTMDLYLGNKTYVKTYGVGLGEEGLETPTGKWRVAKGGKLVKPTWTDPKTGRTYVADDPDYPLGSRYIGLEGIEGNAIDRTGFAIHGTKEPETIRTRSSRGCIRLLNGEVIELYNLLTPELSEVRVVD